MKKAFLVAVLLTAFVGSAYARPFISVGAGFGMYGGTTKRISTAQYGYYDDIVGPGTEFGAPLTISVGYLKEKTFGDGFGVSVFTPKISYPMQILRRQMRALCRIILIIQSIMWHKSLVSKQA